MSKRNYKNLIFYVYSYSIIKLGYLNINRNVLDCKAIGKL